MTSPAGAVLIRIRRHHRLCHRQIFTDAAIKHLSDSTTDIVFMLWGGFAKKKGGLIRKASHRVLETAHPSPLSVTKWRGCRWAGWLAPTHVCD